MKHILNLIFVISTLQTIAQSHWLRIELDVKKMLNPSCNLNEGILDDGRVYVHLGLCSCLENEPFGPETRDCTSAELNQIFCTTQITPFQSRVWQHVVGNWGDEPADDGVGLMTYEGDSVWSIEFVVEDYFSTQSQVNDSSILFTQDLNPYTMGLVFRSSDGFYSGRDNGCNDIFITGIMDYNPQVIQSTDLSVFSAINVTMEKSTELNEYHKELNPTIFPNPSSSKRINISFHKRIINPVATKIYNTLGELVYSNTFSINSNFLSLDLDKIDSGFYTIQLETEQKKYSNKIILK